MRNRFILRAGIILLYMFTKELIVETRERSRLRGPGFPGPVFSSMNAAAFLALAAGLFLCGPAASAQNVSSSIAGTIADSQGAVVANARVTVHNDATGQELKATSDGRGAYTVTNLPPGTYAVTVTEQGFQPETQENVIVD